MPDSRHFLHRFFMQQTRNEEKKRGKRRRYIPAERAEFPLGRAPLGGIFGARQRPRLTATRAAVQRRKLHPFSFISASFFWAKSFRVDRCCCGHSLGQSKQRLAIKPRATVATCKLVRCSRSGNVVDALHKFASGGSLRRTMQTECARVICRYVRQFAACRTRPFDDWPVIRDTTHQIRGASISALRICCCTEGRGVEGGSMTGSGASFSVCWQRMTTSKPKNVSAADKTSGSISQTMRRVAGGALFVSIVARRMRHSRVS